MNNHGFFCIRALKFAEPKEFFNKFFTFLACQANKSQADLEISSFRFQDYFHEVGTTHKITVQSVYKCFYFQKLFHQKNFNRTAISYHLRKQVGVIACLMY